MLRCGGPAPEHRDVTVAEGSRLMRTFGRPGCMIGPPMCKMGGRPGVTLGQVFMSLILTAGFMFSGVSDGRHRTP